MVRTAGYRMAWVGFAEQGDRKSVLPVSRAGHVDGYLESIRITWDDTEHGRGPTGTAVRTGKPCVFRNVGADPLFSPWRTEALRRGYASVAALPLLSEGSVLGAITIYAGEADAFDEQEVALLADLADNLAYGITSLQTRSAREAAEKASRRRMRSWSSGCGSGRPSWPRPTCSSATRSPSAAGWRP